MSTLAIPLTPLSREGLGSASSLQTVLGPESPVGSMMTGPRTARPATDGSVSVRSARGGTAPLSPESHHNHTLDDIDAQGYNDHEQSAVEEFERRRERMRERNWDVLRETLDVLAEEGNVQMCAMLALVCADEMGIGRRRVVRLVEGYLGE